MSIKSALFRIFKNRKICYVNWSLLYACQKWRRYTYFWYPNDPKTDENYRSKFWNVFFGCYKLLTDIKIPPFDSAWKTASDRHHFLAQRNKLKIWPHLTWHDLTLTRNRLKVVLDNYIGLMNEVYVENCS